VKTMNPGMRRASILQNATSVTPASDLPLLWLYDRLIRHLIKFFCNSVDCKGLNTVLVIIGELEGKRTRPEKHIKRNIEMRSCVPLLYWKSSEYYVF